MSREYLEHLYALLHQYTESLHELEMAEAKSVGKVDLNLKYQIEDIRSRIKEIRSEIEKEKDKYPVIPPGPRFGTFLQWPPFSQYARDAHEIFVAGGSLDNLTQLFGGFLVEKAKAGCQVRLVLMDPESPAIPQVERWSDPDLTKDYYRKAICRSLRCLERNDRDRKLKIRLNPSIPALTVMILDGSQPHGRIRVDIQPFQAVVEKRPVFELTRQGEDLRWYDLFYRQYSEKLWSRAKPVDLSNLPPICLQERLEMEATS
jgi:hypothetical protein